MIYLKEGLLSFTYIINIMLVISVTVTTTNGYYITLNKALATYASPNMHSILISIILHLFRT